MEIDKAGRGTEKPTQGRPVMEKTDRDTQGLEIQGETQTRGKDKSLHRDGRTGMCVCV